MRRSLPIVLALLLLPAAALAGPSKEFTSDGFKWTLPDDWSFGTLAPQESEAGFVAKATCDAASIVAYAYAQKTDLDVAGRVEDLRQAGGMGLGNVTALKIVDATLSGVKGKAVLQNIKTDGGAKGHLRSYIMKAGGTLYMLVVQAWHGAHTAEADAMNGVRKGFRLLAGAGEDDADEPMTELEGGGGDAEGEDDNPSLGGSGAGSDGPEAWPATGPKIEGTTAMFDRHNLRWTLPADSEFKWTGAAPDYEKFDTGRLGWATARVKREKQEFEKGTPDENFGRLDLFCVNAGPGFKAVDWVKSGRAQKEAEDWKMFQEITTSKTRTWDDKNLGNVPCAIVKFEGPPVGGGNALMMLFATVLHGKLYIVRAWCWGHTDLWSSMAKPIGEAVKGVAFIDTKELTRGPLLGSTPDYAWHRGEDLDKEKTYRGPGFEFEKPKGVSYIKIRDSMNKEIRWTGEGRTEDGEGYLYFEVRSYKLDVPNQPMIRDEDLIEKRSQDWKAGAGEQADLGGRGGELKMKKGRFRGAGGQTYRFTGTLGGTPFVEEGYVVKHKLNLYWIIMQFGGPDGEKRLKKLSKDVEKGFKFTK